MGKIIDIENEVKTIASSIFATVSGLIAKIRTEVMKLVYEALTEILKLITPKPLQSYTGQATKVITDSIFVYLKIFWEMFLVICLIAL